MNHFFKIYTFLLLFSTIISACTADSDKSTLGKPEAITDYEVTPIYGGAIISYAIPKDRNIQCITAEYIRNGDPYIERSSYYKNSVQIEGFRTTDPITVKLFTENINGERSDPLTVQFIPLKGVVDVTKESINFSTTFGGVVLDWENVTNTELNIHLLAFIDGELKEDEMYFSSASKDKRPFRGFESVETTFAVVVGDKWKNISDTAFYTSTPLFEMEIPKPWVDMRTYVKGDNLTENRASYAFTKFYDGLIGGGSLGYLNVSGSEGGSFTFDLKEVFKLSRFKFWPSLRADRVGDVYGNVNIVEFEMWGSTVLDSYKPNEYWADNEDPTGTFKEDWVYLGYFARERLDLLGATDDEIWQRGAVDGDEFELPTELEPVRYIRFFPRATSEGSPIPNNYWQLGELSFFGSNEIK